GGAETRRQDLKRLILDLPRSAGIQPNCLFMDTPDGPLSLSELWLLEDPSGNGNSAAAYAASGKEGLYLPVNHALDAGSLAPYLRLIENRGLNMVVVDMKDDWGRLRFTPNNPAITEKGRVFRPVDIDGFLKTMKDRGIYTVARIVVFKDPELAGKAGGKYAVWDSQTGRAWTGYYDRRQQKPPPGQEPEANPLVQILPADDPAYEIVRTFYDERWVDPYSEEVWEYIAAVSGELHERGFDEIQFDYIRFPTDGVNLGNARYRWREQGMDMESAILSFLRHVRSRINAPISIDIYGANGWYRTGARTGQEVELLAPYVDVICPMYYPSHFEQDFLAQAPAELRPYRIYYQGVKRAGRIARNKVVIRPYVQAFFLNVAYDRAYYNADYVRREIEGVHGAGNSGFTYWNNSGRYDDIPFPGAGTP
ncbi:MAG: putative glycoside hydrolase, partial [Spirochaetaceae bacterium]|nr:putative glycoside hydrolase [Spirochaetaceae bacterium]